MSEELKVQLAMEQRAEQAVALANVALEREYYKRLYEEAQKKLDTVAPVDGESAPVP